MIDFESSDQLEIGIGDALDGVTAICRDDIVVLESVDVGKFIIRTLTEDEIRVYTGKKYKVDKGNNHGSIKLELWNRMH